MPALCGAAEALQEMAGGEPDLPTASQGEQKHAAVPIPCWSPWASSLAFPGLRTSLPPLKRRSPNPTCLHLPTRARCPQPPQPTMHSSVLELHRVALNPSASPSPPPDAEPRMSKAWAHLPLFPQCPGQSPVHSRHWTKRTCHMHSAGHSSGPKREQHCQQPSPLPCQTHPAQGTDSLAALPATLHRASWSQRAGARGAYMTLERVASEIKASEPESRP